VKKSSPGVKVIGTSRLVTIGEKILLFCRLSGVYEVLQYSVDEDEWSSSAWRLPPELNNVWCAAVML
jgi:hypothetical protein